MAENSVHTAVGRATDSDTFEYAARAGFAVSGVLHLVIAYIIARLAFGSGGSADKSGALATLAGRTGGAVILWVAAAGLVALGLWRVASAIIGPNPGERRGAAGGDSSAFERAQSASVAVVNFAIAYSAAQFALGAGGGQGQSKAGWSARLMQSLWGKALLIAIGLAVIGVGGYHVYKGATRRFFEDLRVRRGPAVTWTGVVGYVAKGLVLAGAGVLVIVATVQADPAKASGIDAAVKTLGQAPFGKALLLFAAAGFAAFAAFNFVRSRHNRM